MLSDTDMNVLDTGTDIKVVTLSQLSQGQDWRITLAHDQPHSLLIWVSRGQGRALLDGQRHGIGAHNAIFIPAGRLYALDLAVQSIGQAIQIPQNIDLRLPQEPALLRLRDVQAQSELSAQIEIIAREYQGTLPLRNEALEAHLAQLSVWLRRQTVSDAHVSARPNAAIRLSNRYAKLICANYANGQPMAHYAEQLGVTPTHLSRSVRTATGRSAAELLTERIVHAARTLLWDSTAPAQQIAAHLGFGSAAYFSRFMQQHTGQSPKKLRSKPVKRGPRDKSAVAI